MNETWRSDPRLKNMDQQKLALLSEFAQNLASAPKEQKMAVFLSLNKQAAEKKLQFSPSEIDLLLSILTDGMSPEEQARVQMIKRLAAGMPGSGFRR